MVKSRTEYNEYMRIYMLARYHKRRSVASVFLGGKCVECDCTTNLEFDHVEPSGKFKTIGRMWSYSEPRFWAEVAKCQLLCRPHHEEKTLRDLGRESARGQHGTLAALRYCHPRCAMCRTVSAKYNRERRRAIRAGTYVSGNVTNKKIDKKLR